MKADLLLSATGELSGKLVFIKEGYDAMSARNEYRDKGKENYLKEFLAQQPWQVEKSEIANTDDADNPFVESYEVMISNQALITGDLMYVSPYVSLKQERNPFVLNERQYPIDLGTLQEKTLICNISLPAGYTVDELPQSKLIRFQDNSIKCTFNIAQTGNRITVVCNLLINKALFDQAEYSGLKDFYTRLVSKMNEQIVLRKIK